MTPKERANYFQFWRYVCARLGWVEQAGLLAPQPGALGYHALRVWHRATEEALRDDRAARLDDLRHATYWLACRRCSLSQINTPAQQAALHGYLLLCLNDRDPVGHILFR